MLAVRCLTSRLKVEMMATNQRNHVNFLPFSQPQTKQSEVSDDEGLKTAGKPFLLRTPTAR